jgi:transcriptional regulator with XRE-family HTH domain
MVLNPEQKQEVYEPYIEILRDNRQSRQMSQSALAELVGLSPKYLTLVEGGKRVPSLECLIALMAEAGVLRKTAEALVKELLDQFKWKD